MEKLGRWIVHEFFEVLPPAIFFLLGFHMLALTRSLMLREYRVHAATAAGATVGALLVAKVVLIADSLPVINRFPERPLAYNVAWKTTIYLLAALVVHYLEHLVPLWWRLGDLGAANHRLLEEIVWPHFWVVQLLARRAAVHVLRDARTDPRDRPPRGEANVFRSGTLRPLARGTG